MMNGWGGYGAYSGGYWWMGLIGMVVQMIFWIGLFVLGVYLFRRIGKQTPIETANRRDALDILRERYARGDIDTEEFNIRRDILQNK
ncbi:MAG: SHOCT domain-containing protein [Desulfosporosinus sp.]|nr:SHOCT domain-containing protein [Desulfosporosinus sp.]